MENININFEDFNAEELIRVAEENGLDFCIVRTYHFGVHFGYLLNRENETVTLVAARRIWKWAGAFSLSEMSVSGVKKPKGCKFSTTVPKVILPNVDEILFCTRTAKENLQSVFDYGEKIDSLFDDYVVTEYDEKGRSDKGSSICDNADGYGSGRGESNCDGNCDGKGYSDMPFDRTGFLE